jgi:hypothetical protein
VSNCVRIQTGDTEPLQVYVVDDSALPLTGLTDLFVRIRRESDGAFFDWDDSTFKAAAWTEQDRVLVELDATYAPGLYEVSGGFDTSVITNLVADDTYQVIPLQTPGTNARLPAPGEIKVGQWVDNVEAIEEAQANVAYDDQSLVMTIAAWMDRNGRSVLVPTSATITLRDATNVVVFTATSVTPFATGVFVFTQAGVVLSDDTVYNLEVSVSDATSTVVTNQSITTVA